MATGNRSVRPPGLLRFSGTTSTAQCAVCSSGSGWGVAGQGPGTYCTGSWVTVVGAAADDGLPLEVEFECPQAVPTITSVIASASSALPAWRPDRMPTTRFEPIRATACGDVDTPDLQRPRENSSKRA